MSWIDIYIIIIIIIIMLENECFYCLLDTNLSW